MIKRVKGLILTAIVAASLGTANQAFAEPSTYRAGEFTITLDNTANGRTYRGCDAQGKCINLDGGTAWRDNGYRGITWDNGEYGYSISWRENSGQMYLNVFQNNERILRRQLVAVEENSIKKVSVHVVTNCDVVNIQSGQLALRYSPNGKSRAGLDNGNYVRLIKQEGIWAYVRVVKGPNSRVNGLEGWVNSDYLSCSQEPID